MADLDKVATIIRYEGPKSAKMTLNVKCDSGFVASKILAHWADSIACLTGMIRCVSRRASSALLLPGRLDISRKVMGGGRFLRHVVQADIAVFEVLGCVQTPGRRRLLHMRRSGQIIASSSRSSTAIELRSFDETLDAADPTIRQAHFYAPRMVMPCQDVLHDALHLPAGGLVSLEDYRNRNAGCYPVPGRYVGCCSASAVIRARWTLGIWPGGCGISRRHGHYH